jgi:hypothetical protein
VESIGEGTVGMEVGMRDKWIYATPTKDDQVIDKYDSQCVFLPHDWRDDVLEDAQAGSTDKERTILLKIKLELVHFPNLFSSPIEGYLNSVSCFLYN